MTSLVSLDRFKEHLHLDIGGTDEDDLLNGLLTAAQRTCEHFIERDIATDDDLTDADLAVIAQAILLVAGAFYDDRAGEAGPPAAAGAILRPLRNLAR